MLSPLKKKIKENIKIAKIKLKIGPAAVVAIFLQTDLL